ncbi:MAG: hypothetical protein AB7E80_01620 [Hyphomicrobiaceae bacterium]
MSLLSRFADGQKVSALSIETNPDEFNPTSLQKYGGAALKALGVAGAAAVLLSGPISAGALGVGLGIGGMLYATGASVQAGASMAVAHDLTPKERAKADAAERRFMKQLIKPL